MLRVIGRGAYGEIWLARTITGAFRAVKVVYRSTFESERAFLSAIQEWGKKIVIVLNKVDLLESQEVDQVVGFIRENARDLLGFTPEIFPVSSRLAQRARNGAGEESWQASRFDAIESFVNGRNVPLVWVLQAVAELAAIKTAVVLGVAMFLFGRRELAEISL